MSIPREFIDQLLNRVDIVDLINTHIPLRKKSGSNYFARCPFHQEKSASFSVSQPKQFFYCFGCGAHGNAIDFLMQHDHLNFPEAIEALARQAGMEVPRSNDAPVKKDDSLPLLLDLMTKTAEYYYDEMCKSQKAINYLKQRGISGAIAKRFMLGYAQGGWSHLLDQFGQTEADKKHLLDAGLIIKKDEGGYYDRFRDRVMFPIHDYRGRIIGFGGRIIDQGEPKYLNSPETTLFQKGHELYGLFQALKSSHKLDQVVIVEGYMDVIALFQHGITYAVATLGTATTAHHLKRLFRYTGDIIFCFDGDQAGRTAAFRALQVVFPLMHDSLQIRFLFLPEGEDPDSLIRKCGKEAFEKSLSQAPSLSDFFFQTLSQQCDLSTMEGRARLATLALEYIRQLPEGIYQGILLDELGKRTRIDVRNFKVGSTTKPDPVPANSEETKTKLPPNMRLALALLVQYPTLARALKDTLPASHIPGYDFLQKLITLLQSQPQANTGSLKEYFRGEKEEAFIAKLAQFEHHIPDTGVEHEFRGIIRMLATQACDAEIDQLLSKASQQSLTEEEKRDLTRLIAHKKTLNNPATVEEG